jgi:hypothetical protein
LVGALFIWALSAAAMARGAIPVAPPDGAKVSSAPTFAWGPGPGEDANRIQLSPDSGLAEDGAFADNPRERTALLDDAQTSYTVPAAQPLTAGAWFWHVEMISFDFDPCCSRWTDVRSVVVEDAPIVLRSFRIGFLRNLDQVVFRVAYSDNSEDLAARYRIAFRKRRHGRTRASLSGKLDSRDLRDGEAFASARRPKRLRRGTRYFARLELRDAAGHVARSHLVRIRL